MDKLYIVIPAYNEAENIENVMREWYEVVEKHNAGGESRLVVVDDGSRDDTYRIMCRFGEGHPLMVALTKENEGHGATVRYAYHYALDNHADYIFQTDSDGQTGAGDFEAFWERRGQYDAIIGSRGERQDGLSRIFVSKVLRLVIFLSFKVWVKDANTPFRLMKGQTLGKYIQYVPEKYFFTNVLLSVLFIKKGCNVQFLPITFRQRQGGENSINLKKIVKLGWSSLGDFRRLNRQISGKV